MSIISAGTSATTALVATGDTTGQLAIETSGSERMRINASGNVGIGTSSPGVRLDIKGSSSNSQIRFAGSGSTINRLYGDDDGIVILSADTGNTAAGSYMAFQVDNTERMRLNTNGAVILQGGSTSASGVGITFPATQSASSDANTLDDYEEGTWTPTYSSNGASFSYVGQTGRYIKVGSMVWISFQLTASASGTVTNDLYVTSLPFAPANVTNNYSSIGGPTSNFSSLPTGITQPTGILLYVSGTVTTMTPTSSGMNGGNKYLWGSMVYSV